VGSIKGLYHAPSVILSEKAAKGSFDAKNYPDAGYEKLFIFTIYLRVDASLRSA